MTLLYLLPLELQALRDIVGLLTLKEGTKQLRSLSDDIRAFSGFILFEL